VEVLDDGLAVWVVAPLGGFVVAVEATVDGASVGGAVAVAVVAGPAVSVEDLLA
jgi:hypothetical protein